MSGSFLQHPYKRLIQALVFFVFCFCCYVYFFSLDSFFILDDLPNFYGLRFVNNTSDAIKYIVDGPAGTRWLSYATFLPHADDWRNQQTFFFKLVNLLIHTANGLLLWRLLATLLPQSRLAPAGASLALPVAVLWFAHPVHANTVLYSVQRMTLLAGSFTLAGLLFHLQFTRRLVTAITIRQWLAYSMILACITLAGVLAKENAILLPAFAGLCLYITGQQCRFSRWQRLLSYALPYVLLLAYLLIGNKLTFGGRGFDMGERLLSQVVIIQQYLFKLLLPNSHSFALLYDDFQPVQSIGDLRLLSAVALWAGIGLFAWQLRTAAPVIVFGLLWFLLGHSLEGSIIPLELYFDHRNYLPSVGIVLAGVIGSRQLLAWLRAKHPQLLPALVFCLALLLANLLWQLKLETALWQDRTAFMISQMQKRPDSLRAKQGYVEFLFEQGRYAEAINAIEQLHQQYGIHASHVIHQALAACFLQADDKINHDAIIADLPSLPFDMSSDNAMESLFQAAKKSVCPSVTFATFRQYAHALLNNPRHRRHFHNYAFLLMHSYIQQGELSMALKESLLLPAKQRSQQYWFTQLQLALAIGDRTQALQLYKDMQEFDAVNQHLFQKELDAFYQQIEQMPANETSH